MRREQIHFWEQTVLVVDDKREQEDRDDRDGAASVDGVNKCY